MMLYKDFSILSWNVCGTVNAKGHCHAKELICLYDLSPILLLETDYLLYLGCTTIYVSLQFQTRTKLWEYLANLCIKIKDSWLLVGDFNEITKPSEVRGGNFSLLRANQFLDIMDKFAFLDLGVVGNPFTW
ncbi:hypothetical protein AAZX31_08G222600, partial [Glycine max]